MQYNKEIKKMYAELIRAADNNNQEAKSIINQIDDSYKKTVPSQ